jgi:hypothetical protein
LPADSTTHSWVVEPLEAGRRVGGLRLTFVLDVGFAPNAGPE